MTRTGCFGREALVPLAHGKLGVVGGESGAEGTVVAEPRWHMASAVVAAIVLIILMPDELESFPRDTPWSMSQENVETLNGVVEAFNTQGLDAALAYVHPELAWHAPPEWLEKQVYRGPEGLRQLAESWGQNFDDYRLDLESVVDLGGNRALALLVQRGRIKAGGNPIELATGWIVEVLDGQLARVDVYFSWESALEAAGLSEEPA